MKGLDFGVVLFALVLALTHCSQGTSSASGTAPPPGGWANAAPTRIEQVVDRGDRQLLDVSQGELRTWVLVPQVGARPGDYVLLGQGTLVRDYEIPELGQRAEALVKISHARVVDFEMARHAVAARASADAVAIAEVYAQLDQRADHELVVSGIVVKATRAVGWNWVHLQDGTGDPQAGTHDLTVKTQMNVAKGQRVGFRGTLRKDVNLGFGYHYDALVEGGSLVTETQH